VTQTVDPPVVAEAPADTHAGRDSTTSVWRWTGSRSVLEAVVAMIVAALSLRIWLVSERWLFSDDLLTGARAATLGLFSHEYLIEDQGGHLVAGPLLLAGWLSRIAPLEWWPQATALIVLQVLATLAVVRLLRLLMGDQPALLVPLAVFLFSTVSLGSVGWWAAAIPALTLQIGLAWFCGDAVLLVRTGRKRHAVTGTLVFLVSLAFYERAILIPALAIALVAVLLHAQEGEVAPARAAWRRGRPLWRGSLLMMAIWVWAFFGLASTETAGSATVGQAVELTRSLLWNLLPSIAGGPWSWTGVPPGTPLADGNPRGFVVAGIGLLALVLWTCRRRRGAVALWLVAGAYVVADALPVALGRGSSNLAPALPLTYRYYAAEAVVLAVVVAVLMVLPRHARAAGEERTLVRRVTAPLSTRLGSSAVLRRGARILVPVLTVLFVAGSVMSTVHYARAWAGDPTEKYMTTAKAALADAGPSPLLDQQIPDAVMWSLFAPYNTAANVFRPLTDRPQFAAATDRLQMLDETGALRPARVDGGLGVAPGPVPGCGWAVPAGGSGTVGLGGALFDWEWTVQLDYVADRDGAITVTMGSGDPVRAPVREGRNTVYLRLVGDGSELRVSAETPGLELCVSSGRVGNITLS
jgi:hypothetical protein